MFVVREKKVMLSQFDTLEEALAYYQVLNGKANGLKIVELIDRGLFCDEIVRVA